MVIATDEFHQLARQSALQSGLAKARIAIVTHPIGGISTGELERRGDAVGEDVMSRFIGR